MEGARSHCSLQRAEAHRERFSAYAHCVDVVGSGRGDALRVWYQVCNRKTGTGPLPEQGVRYKNYPFEEDVCLIVTGLSKPELTARTRTTRLSVR